MKVTTIRNYNIWLHFKKSWAEYVFFGLIFFYSAECI